MNTADILKYGHQTMLNTVDGLPPGDWDVGGVCGVWSVKDIIAHLTSFEHVLVDVLNGFLDGGPTPYLDQFRTNQRFNDEQVARRKHKSAAEVMAECHETHARTMALVTRIPAGGSARRVSPVDRSGPARRAVRNPRRVGRGAR